MSDIHITATDARDQLVARVIDATNRVRTLSWIAPINLPARRLELKDAVLQNSATVQPWIYKDFDADGISEGLESVRTDLLAEAPDGDKLTALTADAINRAARATAAVHSRDDAVFLRWNAERHGAPSAEVLGEARRILDSELPPEPERTLSAADICDAATQALRAYGLDDWSAATNDKMVASMSVRSRKHEVTIRSDARFSNADARRLLVHEVGGHVLRTVNSLRQPERLAQIGLGNATPTEEGFAAWHEEFFGVSSPTILRGYAARVIGIDVASREGVIETARQLAELIGLDRAVDIAIRVKRGLRDPNQPGSFGKDQAYLTGLVQVRRALSERPDDRDLLMMTKWSLDLIELARAERESGRLAGRPLLPDRELLAVDEYADGK